MATFTVMVADKDGNILDSVEVELDTASDDDLANARAAVREAASIDW